VEPELIGGRKVGVVRWIVPGVLAVAAVAVIAAVTLGSDAPAPRACAPAIDRGVLPEWARTGFSEPEPRIAHVIGRRGELAAILFGDPLTAPPREDRSNKILWVARRTPPPGPLRLVAEGGGRTVERVVENGPGPSGVDLPAGCWRIRASWPGGADELDLRYVKG
jgi:hypothetical protein